MEEVILVKNKKFVVVSVMAEHHDHRSLVATWSGRTYLVRTYSEGYEKALADYKQLKHAGINMAKICYHDDENKIIAFDYFPEDSCLIDLSKGPLSEKHYEALFALYRFARFSKIALDWEPQNFMLRGTQMFYLPTKWAPLDDSNKFENAEGGIRTWFLGKEGHKLLSRKGYDVSALPLLADAEVNKTMTLMAVRYW